MIIFLLIAVISLGQTQRLREGGPRFNEEINGLNIFGRVEGSSILRSQGPLGSRRVEDDDDEDDIRRGSLGSRAQGSLGSRGRGSSGSRGSGSFGSRGSGSFGSSRRPMSRQTMTQTDDSTRGVDFGSLGGGAEGFSGFETRGRRRGNGDRLIGNRKNTIGGSSEGLWFFSDGNSTLPDLLKGSVTARLFVSLIERGEVEDILSGPGNFTLFLPAGSYLGAELGSSPSNLEKAVAKNIVLRHVISQRLERDEIPVGLNMFQTLGDTTIMILKGKRFDFLVDVTSDQGEASIKVFNIRGKNGVVHIIDGVL